MKVTWNAIFKSLFSFSTFLSCSPSFCRRDLKFVVFSSDFVSCDFKLVFSFFTCCISCSSNIGIKISVMNYFDWKDFLAIFLNNILANKPRGLKPVLTGRWSLWDRPSWSPESWPTSAGHSQVREPRPHCPPPDLHIYIIFKGWPQKRWIMVRGFLM